MHHVLLGLDVALVYMTLQRHITTTYLFTRHLFRAHSVPDNMPVTLKKKTQKPQALLKNNL